MRQTRHSKSRWNVINTNTNFSRSFCSSTFSSSSSSSDSSSLLMGDDGEYRRAFCFWENALSPWEFCPASRSLSSCPLPGAADISESLLGCFGKLFSCLPSFIHSVGLDWALLPVAEVSSSSWSGVREEVSVSHAVLADCGVSSALVPADPVSSKGIAFCVGKEVGGTLAGSLVLRCSCCGTVTTCREEEI